MHCQRRDAGLFGDAGDGRAILVLAVPAGADLQRHRHIHRGDHGLENVRDQPLIAHQRRTGGLVADLLCRATHVDIDDLCAQLDVALRRFGEHLASPPAICTERLGFVGMGMRNRDLRLFHRRTSLVSISETSGRAGGGNNWRNGLIGHARHGRENQPIRQV